MSLFQYIASTHPLERVENDKVKFFSIQEAIAFGLDVSKIFAGFTSDVCEVDSPRKETSACRVDAASLIEILTSESGHVNIAPDKPNVICWAESEDDYDGINIFPEPREFCDFLEPDKLYVSMLEWRYSESRAEQLIRYLHNHLRTASEVEIGQIWRGRGSEEELTHTRTYPILLEKLRCQDIEAVLGFKNYYFPERIIISRG